MADAKSMASLRNLILSNSPAFQKAKECFETQTDFSLVGETFKKPRYADYPEDLSRWLEKKDICLIANSTDADLLFSDKLADFLCDKFESIKPVYDLMMTAEALVER